MLRQGKKTIVIFGIIAILDVATFGKNGNKFIKVTFLFKLQIWSQLK